MTYRHKELRYKQYQKKHMNAELKCMTAKWVMCKIQWEWIRLARID